MSESVKDGHAGYRRSNDGSDRRADATDGTGLMRRIGRFAERFLFDSPGWIFVAVVHILMLVKTGLWAIPNQILTLHIAQDPFRNPFVDPFAHYLFWNWLDPWLAWLIGATGETSFFLFNLALLAIFNGGVVALLWRDLPARSARLALLAFAAMPISTTVWYWLCSDALTLCLMLATVVWRRYWIAGFLIGILLGLQHFEQGLVSALILLGVAIVHDGWRAARWPAAEPERYPFPASTALALAVGAVLGKLGLIALFDHYDVVVNSGRVHWLREYWPIMLREFATTLWFSVWSVFGVGWLLVARLLDGRRAPAVAFGAALAFLLLVLLPFVGDKTRVLAIVSFPLVMTSLLLNRRLLADWPDADATRFLLLWIVVPWTWVALGTPHLSKFPDDLRWLWAALGA